MLDRTKRLFSSLKGHSDTAQYAAVLALSLLLVRKLFTDHFMGGEDASMYARYLKDAIQQSCAGYFPVYVGQSDFNVLGVSYLQAPYYYNFGVILYHLTIGLLSPVSVQHLTAILSVCGGALSMFHCLKLLYPELGWHRVALSVLYVCCPGVIGIVFMYDMYWSTMTFPYIPLLIYGLVRLERQGDFLASAAILAALAILWPCHPPIALWCTTIACIYVAFFLLFKARRRSQWIYAVMPFVLFPVLNGWHFASVFAMGLQGLEHGKKPFFVDYKLVVAILVQLRDVWPDIFLPVKEGQKTLPNLQLGYALWILALSGTLLALKQTAWRRTEDKTFAAYEYLLFCFWFLVVLLLPIPKVTEALWALAPRVFTITRVWPMERFYLILAAIACMAGAKVLETVSSQKTLYRRVFMGLILGSYFWALFEGSKITSIAAMTTTQEIEPPYLWAEYADNEAIDAGHEAAKFPNDVHDLCLENTLFDATSLREITSNRPLGNPAFLLEPTPSIKPDYTIRTSSTAQGVGAVLTVRMKPGLRYALVYELSNDGYTGFVFLAAGRTLLRKYASFLQQNVLTAWVRGSEEVDLSFVIVGASERANREATLAIRNIRVYSYTPQALPVSIKSFTPYTADVNQNVATVLETNKCYYPGYHAVVNGSETEVIRSARGMAAIALPAGANHVVLDYRGTGIMRLAFLLNCAAWFVLGYFNLRHRSRQDHPASLL